VRVLLAKGRVHWNGISESSAEICGQSGPSVTRNKVVVNDNETCHQSSKCEITIAFEFLVLFLLVDVTMKLAYHGKRKMIPCLAP